jgi:hypothetical protein
LPPRATASAAPPERVQAASERCSDLSGTGFSLCAFSIHQETKSHRLKPAPLVKLLT